MTATMLARSGLVLAVALSAPTLAQQLPPAATPGGAQPQIERPRPPAPAAPPIEVPAEPPAPPVDTGARMQVSAFVLEGVTERPEFAIEPREIDELVESLRRKYPQGMGIAQLREVTRAVTLYYRERGFFLARAYIPEQSVKDGVVRVRVLEGVLADVQPQNNVLYSSDLLQRPFDELTGEPVHTDSIEREMLRVNRYPGYGGSGVFRPGEAPGTTTLLLDTRYEDAFSAAVWFDNHGTELTGENRLFGEIVVNNALDVGEQFRLLGLQTLDPSNSTFFSLDYQQPVFSPRYTLYAGLSNNTFSVGDVFKQLDIEGESTTYRAAVSRSFILSRARSLDAGLDLARKSASSTQAGTDIGDDELLVLTANGEFQFVDADFRSSNLIRAALRAGIPEALGAMDESGDPDSSRTSGSGERAGGDFTKLTLNFSRIQALPQKPFFRNQSVLMRVDFQHSDDLLTSLERMPLGGPNSVRAYPPSEFLADTGTFLSLEWIASSVIDDPASFWRGLQLSGFLDYADGELNDPLTNEKGSIHLAGFGGGARLNPWRRLDVKLELATAIGDPEPSDDSSFQFNFGLRYDF